MEVPTVATKEWALIGLVMSKFKKDGQTVTCPIWTRTDGSDTADVIVTRVRQAQMVLLEAFEKMEKP